MSVAGASRFDLFGRIIIQGTGTASANLGRVSRSFKGLQSGINGARQAANGVSQLAGALAAIGTVAAGGLVYAGKKFMDFEKQMSAVSAVLMVESGKYDEMLTNRAKELGAATVWTATQVGEGMEELARSGFSGLEVYESIPGVLNLAAAEGMNLRRAAMYVSSSLHAFGMNASQAVHVADVFAAASTTSATNVELLGTALRYAQGQAKNMGMTLEDTVTVLGLAANAGLRGSIGGTSMGQSLIQLQRPTEKAKKYLREMGIEAKDAQGNFVGYLGPNGLIEQLRRGLQVYQGDLDKSRAISEIFNVRGSRFINALLKATDTSNAKSKIAYDRLVNYVQNASKGAGASTEMAKKKLDNLYGDWIIALSKFETFSINAFQRFGSTARKEVTSAGDVFGNLAQGLSYLHTKDPTPELVTNWKKLPNVFREASYGILDGVERVRKSYESAKEVILGAFNKQVDSSDGGIKGLTADFIHFTGIAAGSVPVLGGVAVASRILSGSIDTLVGSFRVLQSPIGWAIPPLALALIALGDEGESAFDTLIRVVKDFYNIIDMIVTPIKLIRDTFGDLTAIAATAAGFKLIQAFGSFGLGTVTGKLGTSATSGGIASMLGVQRVFVVNWPAGGLLGGVGGAAGGAGAGAVGTGALGAGGAAGGATGVAALLASPAVVAAIAVAGSAVMTGISASVIGSISRKAHEAAERERKQVEERRQLRKQEEDIRSADYIVGRRREMVEERRYRGWSAVDVSDALVGKGYLTSEGRVGVGTADVAPFISYMENVKGLFRRGFTDQANRALQELEKYGIGASYDGKTFDIQPVVSRIDRMKLNRLARENAVTMPYDVAYSKALEQVNKSSNVNYEALNEMNNHLQEIRELLKKPQRGKTKVTITNADVSTSGELRSTKKPSTIVTLENFGDNEGVSK